jgi:glycerol uptake facilitator-like aquaporin
MVYLTYLYDLETFKDGMYSLKTAGIFATYPASGEAYGGTIYFSNIFDQFFATFLFIMAVLAITDAKNTQIPHVIKAVLIGLVLLIIGTSYGFNCGFPVNPARDFAPRLFTLIAGWGTKTFTACNYFFWIPLVSPMIGAAVGTFVYQIFIANHWPEDVL